MVCEIPALRTEDTKHFQLADGSFQAVVYGAPVHRRDAGGEWEEIDNTLYAQGKVFQTKDGRFAFSSEINHDVPLLTLSDGKCKIKTSVAGNVRNSAGIVSDPVQPEEGLTKLEQLQQVETLRGSI